MAMKNAASILDRVRGSTSGDPVPTASEIRAWAAASREALERTSFSELVRAQLRAAEIWGSEQTSHFGMILRELRVTDKRAPDTAWVTAEKAAARLPDPWRSAFQERISLSRSAKAHDRLLVMSAARLTAVAAAWGRWLRYCEQTATDVRPTATGLEAYAETITCEQEPPVSRTSCACYLERIVAAYKLAVPAFKSDACTFVVTQHREAARRSGTPTKTGAQLVGASAIYDHGFKLMERGRSNPLRGPHAARDFRNGILLAVGISMPQRARALSRLVYDETLYLLEPGVIRVCLSGEALKLPEIEKPFAQFDRTFRNPGLYAALVEYRDVFRPIMDPGKWLFPSCLDRTRAITEATVGSLTGNLLAREFDVRIPVHRLRDNVATEASEELEQGSRAVGPMLGHSSATTGQRHYDHSEGIKAAREHAAFLDRKRSAPCKLKL